MNSEIIDRLRVPESVSQSLHARRSATGQQADSRQYPRRYVVAKGIVEYEGGLPAFPRQPQRHSVLLADLSRRGLRFLHSEQLFPGELAVVQIPGGKQLRIEVARCRRIAECCYEVGAKFSAGV